jgi:hypothetical protein
MLKSKLNEPYGPFYIQSSILVLNKKRSKQANNSNNLKVKPIYLL